MRRIIPSLWAGKLPSCRPDSFFERFRNARTQQSAKQVFALPPIRKKAIHKRLEARAMARLQKMAKLVDDDVLQTTRRPRGQSDVDADAACRGLAGAPSTCHVSVYKPLDAPLDPHNRRPMLDKDRNARLNEGFPFRTLLVARSRDHTVRRLSELFPTLRYPLASRFEHGGYLAFRNPRWRAHGHSAVLANAHGDVLDFSPLDLSDERPAIHRKAPGGARPLTTRHSRPLLSGEDLSGREPSSPKKPMQGRQ